jgi:hypothetical protein
VSEDETAPPLAAADEAARTPSSRGRARAVALTSRLAVWGLVAALLPPLAETFGGPFWLQRADWLVAAGFMASGIGTLTVSLLVLRSLPSGASGLKLTAVAGIPLGIGLLFGAAAVLNPLSRLADFVDAGGPLVLLLGVLVFVSLLTVFLRGADP